MAYMDLNFHSLSLMRFCNASVILPVKGGAVDFEPPFKTLYFLPGFSANTTSIMTMMPFNFWAALKGIAVVVPDGENSFYVNHPERWMNYEEYIAKELVETTRQMFPLSDKREDTFIGGVSMGGYGALTLGMKYPDTFSMIMAFSPGGRFYDMGRDPENPFTIEYFDSVFTSEKEYNAKYEPVNLVREMVNKGINVPDIYMCCGEQDPLTYKCDCELAQVFEELKVKHKYVQGGGDHSPIYWNAHLEEGIDYLLSP